MTIFRGPASRWLAHSLGWTTAETQLTSGERACLRKHAAGRRRLVELGVMYGATTALLREVMAADGLVVGVDPHPTGRLGVSFERLVARNELARSGHGRAELLRLRSEEACKDWREPIDFLFIDADHSWNAVQRDWTEWTPHLVPGGVVALHDSRSVPDHQDFDSVRFTQTVVLVDHVLPSWTKWTA